MPDHTVDLAAYAALEAENARLRAALGLSAEALEDYGHHTARCSWDGRMDAESVCDCGLEEAQRAARAALKGTPDA